MLNWRSRLISYHCFQQPSGT